MEEERIKLKEEIRKLQETDQGYFDTALDLIKEGNYREALEKLKEMKMRFPTSKLIAEADKK